MRTVHNYVQAVKARREENGDEGFSLIELIVVVVILGILAAVAIPVFLGLQGQAEQTSQDAVAANAASQAAAAFADAATTDPAVTTDGSFATNLNDDGAYDIDIAIGAVGGTTLSLDNFCVTVSGVGADPSTAGPGC